MRLATLVTNTDDSDFAKARPLDDAKFAGLIHSVRPDWQIEAFWVCKDDFPSDLSGFDGVMITGSPASLNEGAPWMAHLEALIHEIIDAKVPLFGACFGHQAIAKALGSPITRNPCGWAHGRIPVTRTATGETFHLYGSHIEQVGTVPNGARIVFESPGTPNAGFAIGTHVLTIQHHPEMSHAFIADLVEHLADYVGPEVTEAARASLHAPADSRAFAEEIAEFFEAARAG
jgi:GMP synthase-like glutamine amidotransferase